MRLTPEMLEAVDASVLCWLATTDAEGRPNVSPKEVFLADGPDLLIAHIASPRSARNVTLNPHVCVAVVDVFEQRGFKLSGRAALVTSDDDEFPRLVGRLKELTKGRFPVKAVIRVVVERAEPIVAPSSWLYPEVDPLTRRRSVLATYQVTDAGPRRARLAGRA